MPDALPTTPSAPVYRIDRFDVPTKALRAFMERVHIIQRLLDGRPGCRQNLVLTRMSDHGEFNVMTVVEWQDTDAMASARAYIKATYAKEGFEPAAFMDSLGVRAELGLYGLA